MAMNDDDNKENYIYYMRSIKFCNGYYAVWLSKGKNVFALNFIGYDNFGDLLSFEIFFVLLLR